MPWKLNTSNQGKFEEFKRLFAQGGEILSATHRDLKEIDADALTVITHKASQLEENILVDDTSLDIEGMDCGIHVRWLLDHLSQYAGRAATFTVLLGHHRGEEIHIYQGSVSGMIVHPEGEGGFGFDPIFLPDGAQETLAKFKPDHLNARALAVEALLNEQIYATRPLLKQWDGPWQEH